MLEETLNKQINVANELLKKARSIPDGSASIHLAGFIKYDEQYTRPIITETEAWEAETVEILRILYGEKARQVSDFQKCLRPKSHYTRFREDIQTDLNRSIGFLQALIKADVIRKQVSSSAVNIADSKTPMIFISHSSKDKEFVEGLVNLLEGIGFTATNMFCSSFPEYGIGLSQNIFETIWNLFNNHELYVIFVQSPRYYDSAVSLNEMGAAWILKSDFCSILTKDMTREQMRGVVNGDTIYIKVDSDDAPARMNELKDVLIKRFDLGKISPSVWERKRNAFLRLSNAINYELIPDETIKADDELKALQLEQLRMDAQERKQAVIRGNIIKGVKAGSRTLKIFNAGKATARDVNVEWLNPNDETFVHWKLGLLGELSPQNSRCFNLVVCKGSFSTMRLRYSWSDNYSEANTFEEELQI